MLTIEQAPAHSDPDRDECAAALRVVSSSTSDEVTAWVGTDRDRCEWALHHELRAARARNELVDRLSQLLARDGYLRACCSTCGASIVGEGNTCDECWQARREYREAQEMERRATGHYTMRGSAKC